MWIKRDPITMADQFCLFIESFSEHFQTSDHVKRETMLLILERMYAVPEVQITNLAIKATNVGFKT